MPRPRSVPHLAALSLALAWMGGCSWGFPHDEIRRATVRPHLEQTKFSRGQVNGETVVEWRGFIGGKQAAQGILTLPRGSLDCPVFRIYGFLGPDAQWGLLPDDEYVRVGRVMSSRSYRPLTHECDVWMRIDQGTPTTWTIVHFDVRNAVGARAISLEQERGLYPWYTGPLVVVTFPVRLVNDVTITVLRLFIPIWAP